MKSALDELSDDDGEVFRVNVSRVLGPRLSNSQIASARVSASMPRKADVGGSENGESMVNAAKSLPPLDSFAFQSKPKRTAAIQDLDEDGATVGHPTKKRKLRRYIVSDDSSDEDFDPVLCKETEAHGKAPEFSSRRGQNQNGWSLEDDEAIARVLQEEEEFAIIGSEAQTQENESPMTEVDLIGNALQKCDEVAALLRRELNIGSSSDNDRYAEVDASAAKVVSQADVCAACGTAETDLQLNLKPYQLVGVNFLLLLHRKNVGGAILADEMGLGKTIQAISFLAVLNYLDKDPGPHLVICPASLLENWARELKKWCPYFKVVSYHGAERSVLFKDLNHVAKAGRPAPFNVMLACYSLFERHSAQQKDDRKLLKRFTWSCVLMDEAHLLKDRASSRRKNLWAVAQKAKQRLLLTGTPLQNDLQELWSLLEFMVPEIFDSGDCDLKKIFGNRNIGTDAPIEDMDLIGRIKVILGPFVLRRLKSDVMRQLVPKIQKVETLEMLSDQASAYKAAIEEYRAAALVARTNKAANANATDFLPRRQVSNYFTQFRKIANHPLLVRRIYTEDDVDSLARKLHPMGAFGFECTFERVKEELLTYSDFALHRISASYGGIGRRGALTNSYALGSAKCQALSKLLPKLQREGHRALIFSQWTGMMDILEWALDVLGLDYTRLDGNTQVAERQNIIDNYNNDPEIFACLLSTRAGGQGLNLTGADTVIIHDMDFNPQMDRQAEDRCHRIGQTKPVTVYRLVTKGTVDENIYSIAKRKLTLDAAVLEAGVETVSDNNESDVLTMGAILSAILDAAPS